MDKIYVNGLQLPFGVVAPDVWGKDKEQPAFVSVALSLPSGFNTAASLDELDDSTIHYGTLSKNIRAGCTQGQSVDQLITGIVQAVHGMATKAQHRFIISQAVMEIHLPKASMSGEATSVIYTTNYKDSVYILGCELGLRLEDVKIMTLVGVNDYERAKKQSVVAHLTLRLPDPDPYQRKALVASLFQVESMLVEIIQATTFETLETLAEYTFQRLRRALLDRALPGAVVKLKLEKPRAIAWAHAPAVEITRTVPAATNQ